MFAALILGQALAYGAPYYPVECDCPQASYEQPHEEVRLNGDFFIGEGGVGPAYAISAAIFNAASRGLAASVIGRPTTR